VGEHSDCRGRSRLSSPKAYLAGQYDQLLIRYYSGFSYLVYHIEADLAAHHHIRHIVEEEAVESQ
jgi:hypothetical protein